MEIVKTIPASELDPARDKFKSVGETAAEALINASKARAAIIDGLIKYAVNNGIAPKVAVQDIMREVVLPCTRTKAEDQKLRDMERAKVTPPTELAGKLAYPTGHAHAKSIEIAILQSKPFAVSLYAASLTEAKKAREAAHAQKVAQAETAAKDAAAKAKTLATKAARSKSVEVKLAAEQAKLDAAKAQEAVRAVIDKAPVTQKTGGRKAAPKSGPVKALTRHEVALHLSIGLAQMRQLGKEEAVAAEEIADILESINLLAK